MRFNVARGGCIYGRHTLSCKKHGANSQKAYFQSVFSSDTALLKALYLATFEATKKRTMLLRNWGKVYGKL